MSKKKKNSTVTDRPSVLSVKSSPSKKQKTGSKKSKHKKPNAAQQPPPSPPFSATSITLQNTKFTRTAMIASTRPLTDKSNQISLCLCISTSSDDSTYFNWCSIDINSDIPLTKPNLNWCSIDINIDFSLTKPNPIPKPKPKSKPKISHLDPFCSMPDSTPQKFRSVPTLDSKIYALGGIDTSIDGSNPSSKVFVCDFSTPDSYYYPYWEELPPMQSPKVCPAAASSFDGKIYALGSFESQLEDPFGEFFDPTTNSWTQLPRPPTDENLTDYVFARDRNKLICFFNDSAYSFDLHDWSWKCINVIGKEVSYGLSKSVAVGDVIYTFQKRNVYAFDLSMANPTLEPVYGLEKATAFIGDYDSVCLLYIGYGRMCLVSARQNSDGLLNIACSRFSVGTYMKNDRLHAVGVLVNSEEFVAEGSELYDCLAVAIPDSVLEGMADV